MLVALSVHNSPLIVHHSFMRFLLIFFFFQILLACNESQPAPQTSQPVGVTFQFSKAAANKDLNDLNSWCNGAFDAVLINADPANVNRRFFQMNEGVHRVAVQLGNATNSFFLKKTGEKTVEVFTSDNFPMCASSRANFTLAADGASLSYDNKMHITYSVTVQLSPEGLFVVLDFPKEITYGLTVHRCGGCR